MPIQEIQLEQHAIFIRGYINLLLKNESPSWMATCPTIEPFICSPLSAVLMFTYSTAGTTSGSPASLSFAPMKNLNIDSCDVYSSCKSLKTLPAKVNTLSAQSSTDSPCPCLGPENFTLVGNQTSSQACQLPLGSQVPPPGP
ncbi:hypothetical protein DPMN_156671 [Dreissena polymorpha]|uniref:Uncharacterized protein n=1 Tax=Dreissena polymorpha TaxID=45954 RepID=A0A9D4FQ71_DREPO|nr:hypothetical protein DPMN_156671 [Dreissena polymorpha]